MTFGPLVNAQAAARMFRDRDGTTLVAVVTDETLQAVAQELAAEFTRIVSDRPYTRERGEGHVMAALDPDQARAIMDVVLTPPPEGARAALYTNEPVETPGPRGPLGSLGTELAAAGGDKLTAQAFAALREVATALGVYEATWAARSIIEVGRMLVAEIARRDTLATSWASTPPDWVPVEGQRMAGLAVPHEEDPTRRVAGGDCCYIHTQSGDVAGIALHDAAPGDPLTIITTGQPPRPPRPPRTGWAPPAPPAPVVPVADVTAGDDPEWAAMATNVYDELVTRWRRQAATHQMDAGNVPPSQVAAALHHDVTAEVLEACAAQLADATEPARTRKAADHG